MIISFGLGIVNRTKETLRFEHFLDLKPILSPVYITIMILVYIYIWTGHWDRIGGKKKKKKRPSLLWIYEY